MLKDITLGQYFPGDSVIHKLDPRTKLLFTLFYVILIFFVRNIIGYTVMLAMLVIVIGIAKTPVRTVLRSIRPLILIIVLTGLLNLFYIPGEELWRWGFLRITDRGVVMAAFMILRLIFLIVGTSMLTYTTSPILLTNAIERLLGPLKRIKLPVHELAMMMSIALRMIPTLIEETDKILNAQKARGGDFESGGLIRRAKSLIPVLVPLFISAFRRADELAVAMECRCYRGGEGRTSLRRLKMALRDAGALLVAGAMLALVLLINTLPYGWAL